jgi:hypothetical protein
MARTLGPLLVLTIVVASGCIGVFGGPGTTTPAAGPANGSADDSAETSLAAPASDSTGTPAVTPTGVSTATANRSYTLFSGGSPRSNASLGPSTFVAGQPVTVPVTIDNREGQRTNYTTVVQIVRLDRTGSDASGTERRVLDRFTTSLAAGESRTTTRTVVPNMTGQGLLLTFLLYKSDPPATPTTGNAHQYFANPITVNSSQQTNRPSS